MCRKNTTFYFSFATFYFSADNIEQRKVLWEKSFEAFKDDKVYQKEQLELAEAGINDGLEED
ncbi:hypothetical protein CEV87_09085 [Campylobacter jejuni]|nr:hypothetical protein [Campylobacter jejuni]